MYTGDVPDPYFPEHSLRGFDWNPVLLLSNDGGRFEPASRIPAASRRLADLRPDKFHDLLERCAGLKDGGDSQFF
jgi:hypothetical protein